MRSREMAEELSRNLPNGARDGLLGRDPGELAKKLRAWRARAPRTCSRICAPADRDIAA